MLHFVELDFFVIFDPEINFISYFAIIKEPEKNLWAILVIDINFYRFLDDKPINYLPLLIKMNEFIINFNISFRDSILLLR